jgi:hypothetical protein
MDDLADGFPLQSIAYHEAGHAVVATARSWMVVPVAIIPSDGRVGRCDVDGNPRCADTTWGGPVAHGICLGQPRPSIDPPPYFVKGRADALDYSGNDAGVCAAHLDVVRAHLADPLHRRQLRAVANELLEAEVLSGNRVRELMMRARKPMPP